MGLLLLGVLVTGFFWWVRRNRRDSSQPTAGLQQPFQLRPYEGKNPMVATLDSYNAGITVSSYTRPLFLPWTEFNSDQTLKFGRQLNKLVNQYKT